MEFYIIKGTFFQINKFGILFPSFLIQNTFGNLEGFLFINSIVRDRFFLTTNYCREYVPLFSNDDVYEGKKEENGTEEGGLHINWAD